MSAGVSKAPSKRAAPTRLKNVAAAANAGFTVPSRRVRPQSFVP